MITPEALKRFREIAESSPDVYRLDGPKEWRKESAYFYFEARKIIPCLLDDIERLNRDIDHYVRREISLINTRDILIDMLEKIADGVFPDDWDAIDCWLKTKEIAREALEKVKKNEKI